MERRSACTGLVFGAAGHFTAAVECASCLSVIMCSYFSSLSSSFSNKVQNRSYAIFINTFVGLQLCLLLLFFQSFFIVFDTGCVSLGMSGSDEILFKK